MDLAPALIVAGEGFENFAGGTDAVAEALETARCDSSGSNEDDQILAEDNKYLANNISAFAAANAQETNRVLKLYCQQTGALVWKLGRCY